MTKHGPKWLKNYDASHLRNHTLYDLHLCYTCVKGYYLQVFFTFFPDFNFQGQYWSKRAKNGPKWQSLCQPHSISQEAYIIWLWFLVDKWKMMTDTFFRFFKILIVQVVRGVKVQKMAQNDKKLCLTLNVRNCTYMIVVFGTMCKMMISLAIFFFFFQNSDSCFYGRGLR